MEGLVDRNESASEKFEDFYAFCTFVLKYEEKMTFDKIGRLVFDSDRSRTNSTNQPPPPHDTSGGKEEDEEEEIKEKEDEQEEETESDSDTSDQVDCTSDEESWNLITCYCGRPYAGRPMIECSKCLTWVHLYCARIKKTNVPDVFICQKCKGSQRSTSSRYKFRI